MERSSKMDESFNVTVPQLKEKTMNRHKLNSQGISNTDQTGHTRKGLETNRKKHKLKGTASQIHNRYNTDK